MVENLSPNNPESSSSDDDDTDPKSKSKKKAIGAFAVVAKPSAKVNPKREGLWSFTKSNEAKSDDQTADKIDFFKKLQSPDTQKELEAIKSKTEQQLEPDEIASAVQQLAAARLAEVAADPNYSEATVEDDAVQAYLEAAADSGDIEEAFTEVAATLEQPAEQSEGIDKPADNEAVLIDPSKISEGEINLHHENADDEEAPAVNPTTTTNRSASKPTQAPTPPSQPANSGANLPPLPPVGRTSAPQPPFSSRGGAPFNTINVAPTAVQFASNPNTISTATAATNERRALGNGLIVGGIVGYLYGRRRGRIKTEKRLAPVRKSLERQVKSLQTELLYKEEVIRAKVRGVEAPLLPKVSTAGTESAAAKSRPEASAASAAKSNESAARIYETIFEPHIAKPEDIGHVMVAATTNPERSISTKPAKMTKAEELSAGKQAETMNRSELLGLSEKIAVDGTTLRQIYETQLISEKGMRRIVAEHLRGGNVAKALRRELVERQIDFERDPILRDKNHGGGSDGGGKSALGAMLVKAGVSQPDDAEVIGSKVSKKKKTQTSQTDQSVAPKSTVADVSLIVLISVLLLIIIIVLMRGY